MKLFSLSLPSNFSLFLSSLLANLVKLNESRGTYLTTCRFSLLSTCMRVRVLLVSICVKIAHVSYVVMLILYNLTLARI